MSVLISIIMFLIIAWLYGSDNYAINITVFVLVFGIAELINNKLTGTTITGNFWEWKKKTERWKVYAIGISIILLGIFLAGHLVFEW